MKPSNNLLRLARDRWEAGDLESAVSRILEYLDAHAGGATVSERERVGPFCSHGFPWGDCLRRCMPPGYADSKSGTPAAPQPATGDGTGPLREGEVFILETEDISEAEAEGRPCWFPTSEREGHGDGEVDAVHGARITPPEAAMGYRFRVVRYCRAENADEWHELYAHEMDRRETAEQAVEELKEKLAAANRKWTDYEQSYILPCFKWAEECGLDLRALIARGGGNAVSLLVQALMQQAQEAKEKLASAEAELSVFRDTLETRVRHVADAVERAEKAEARVAELEKANR